MMLSRTVVALGLAATGSIVPPAAPPTTLTVFAAASLTDAFQELGATMERTNPGLKVHFNFAGSQQLAVQLEQGAAADVFASADPRWMSYVQEHDLLGASPEVFAHNHLVVIVPRTNPARIGRLEDLTRRGVKLVLAAEAVPAGKYSREAVHNLDGAPGFPPDYSRRVLGNIVSEEENVKAVVAKVQLGEADAGLVYRSDVTRSVAGKVRVFQIPERYNVTARYPVAVLKGAENPSAARAFVELVLGSEGQRVLERHGLIPVAAALPATTPTNP
jgi:molybdate transport system substrate-binding protein